ncbi:MAG: Rieske (2Fe-2S) protein [Mycobacterium sp.]
MDLEHPRLNRRTVFVGTGISVIAAAAAACSTDTQQSTGSSAPASGAAADSTAAETTEQVVPTAPKAIAKTAQVPLGSGVIIGDTVITQPAAGVFTGLSAICTHQGCTVNKIADGTISCPCHGSKFNLDGSVANGPANRPLSAKAVSVQGDSIMLG